MIALVADGNGFHVYKCGDWEIHKYLGRIWQGSSSAWIFTSLVPCEDNDFREVQAPLTILNLHYRNGVDIIGG